MTKASGLMVHLIPDVMYIEPSDNSRAIVIGVLNMHLSFKFKKRAKRVKTEEDTIIGQWSQLAIAVGALKTAIENTPLVISIKRTATYLSQEEGGKQ
jgi:hypothetical protein